MPDGASSSIGELLTVGDPTTKTLIRQQPRTDAVGLLDGYAAALYPPPLDPDMWAADGDVTVFDSATQVSKGQRISPKAMYSIGGVYAMLYQGNDAPSFVNDLDSRLAWSLNLTDWKDGPILLAEPDKSSWEGSRNRAIGLVYDTVREEWVLFFEGNGSSVLPSPTKRAIGFATSKRFTGPYTKHSSPVILSNTADIHDWAPNGASNDVAYGMAVTHVNGTYYMYVMAGDRGTRDYATGILTATSPLGPWTGGAHNPVLSPAADNWEDGQAFVQQPTFVTSEQKWYLPYYNPDGQIGFSVSSNASQLSTWTKHPDPVITMPGGADGMQNVIFPVPGGGWAGLIAIGGDGGQEQGTENTKVKLVTSHISAAEIFRPLTEIRTGLTGKLQAANNLNDLASKVTSVNNLLDEGSVQSATWDRLLEGLPTTEPSGGLKPWIDNGVLKVTPTPPIDGDPYPGETLTSLQTGTWNVGGVDVAGTSKTYTVTTGDIGKTITQTVNGSLYDTVTVWHPNDEAGVKLVLLGDKEVFTSTGPDVAALHNESVLNWNDQSGNNYTATQATLEERPVFRSDSIDIVNSVRFETINNDHLDLSGGALDLFRNVNYGYIIAAVEDEVPSGGEALHYAWNWGISGASQARLALTTRNGSNFSIFSRAVDSGVNTTASVAQAAGWNVITGEGAFAIGKLRIRLNGVQGGEADLPQSQATPNTASDYAKIGTSGLETGDFPGKIACLIGVSGASALSTAALARLERYAGLLIGKNIPLA